MSGTKKEKINIEDIKDKNVFDLTKEEFAVYFKHNIRKQTNKLVRIMRILDAIFVEGRSKRDGFIFFIFLSVPYSFWLIILTGDLVSFPGKVQDVLFYLIHNYPVLWPVVSFILIFAIWTPIAIFLWIRLVRLIFDKPAKKIIFKELGFQYYNGLFYFSDFEHIAKHFSKLLFRVDEMIQGTYKGQKLTIIDCVEKGFSHKIFIATKINRKFSAQTLIETKGSLNPQFFNGRQVNLEDINFSKVYNVFSDDQVEARYILTPTFMERLLKYNPKKAGNAQVFFSDKLSQDYNVFFYIPVKDNWFEMPTSEISFVKYIHPNWFYSFLQDIKEIMLVVEALKLDQDIGM